MATGILVELRKKVSNSFGNDNTLIFVKSHWNNIVGMPSDVINISTLLGNKVNKSGDTMTGQLNVPNASADANALNRITADGRYATLVHNHTIAQITGLQISLNMKQDSITGAATTITSDDLIVNRALVSDNAGKVAVSGITLTELGRLSGVSSNIQTQLDGKAASSHTHTIAQVTDLQTALNGKVDRYASVNGLDMNNVTETGFYFGYDMTNAALTTISTFIVINYSNDWIIQKQFVPSGGGNREFIRSRHSGTTWSSWSELPDKTWVINSTRSNVWTPTWAQVSGKPSWIGANKPDYTTDDVQATLANQYVSASDKLTWSGKQNALGFTPENAANKRTSIRTSGAENTSYVTELGVKTYVDGLIGSVYRPSGDWNAATNSPTLANSTPANAGKVYRVSVAGTRFGFTFAVGDKLAFNEDGVISKWDNVDDVVTVNGQAGTVVLTTDDINEGTNLYVSQSDKSTWNAKQSAITGAATTITSSDLSANSVLISSPSGKVEASAVSSTKLVHLSGVTSDIQTQLNGKAASSHTHSIAQVTGLQGALDGKAPLGHNHNILAFSNLESDLGLDGLRIKQYSDSSSPDGGAWHHALRIQHGGYAANGYYREILLPFGSDRAFITKVTNSTTKSIVELATLPWVMENSRSGSWTPTWAQVSGKPSWIGANKPDYTTDDVTATLANQYVSASDKLTWSGKQNALGFTPENAANKRTSIRTSGAENTSYVSELGVKNYVDGIAPVKLLRARSGTNALTIYSNSSVTGIGSQLTRGDTIMVEVLGGSDITTATPKILTFTLSENSLSNSMPGAVSFTTLAGGILQVWSLTCALISGALTFGNAGTLQMSKSGTDMVITNTTWTPYIGRIWRVVG